MNLKEQSYIIAVANCKSFTKAAEELHVSQPALSSFVGRLEASLGVKLFNRHAKELEPTYAGELYISAARGMLSAKDEFDAILSDLRLDQGGRLRIGMQTRRSPYVIPTFYREFSRLYPKVELSFAEGVIDELETMLNNNELDFIICNQIHAAKNYEYIKIADERLLFAVSKTHRFAPLAVDKYRHGLKWIDLRHFDGETFILQRPSQSQRVASDALMKSMNVKPGRIIEISNIETSNRMAALGAGVSFALETYVRHFNFQPSPDYFLTGVEAPALALVAAHKKGSYMPCFIEPAIEIIRRNLCPAHDR